MELKEIELKEILDRLYRAEVDALVANKTASKAMDMAMEALVEVRAMKKSTHKVELVNTNPLANDVIKEMHEALKSTETEESEPVPQAPMKLSPFTMFSRPALRTVQKGEESSKVLGEAINPLTVDPFDFTDQDEA